MISYEHQNPIGKEILSIVFGVGIISGVEKIQEDGDDYFVVEFGDQKTKNYLPIKENKKSRFLNTEEDFLKNLNELKTKSTSKKFQNKKERQSYFSSALADSNLSQMVNKILEIQSIKDLVPNEKEKLNKLLTTLEAEASAIYKMNSDDSKKFISEFLN